MQKLFVHVQFIHSLNLYNKLNKKMNEWICLVRFTQILFSKIFTIGKCAYIIYGCKIFLVEKLRISNLL